MGAREGGEGSSEDGNTKELRLGKSCVVKVGPQHGCNTSPPTFTIATDRIFGVHLDIFANRSTYHMVFTKMLV